jgi:hypothetical protein
MNKLTKDVLVRTDERESKERYSKESQPGDGEEHEGHNDG